jgi:uncharacterized protein with NRDE domain
MCTVTFIRNKQHIFITSNRDESIHRPNAEMPRVYNYNGVDLYYPKDPKGNGTWFAVNKNGNVIVLLNGAETKHVVANNYKLSRGVIVLQIASADDYLFYFDQLDLVDIEPFTIVCFFNHALHQLRWDGLQKTCVALQKDYYIWSSSTLYDAQQIADRQNYFTTYFADASIIDSQYIINFHQTPIHADVNIVINRQNEMLTKNVTQVAITNSTCNLMHVDLITKQQASLVFAIS